MGTVHVLVNMVIEVDVDGFGFGFTVGVCGGVGVVLNF